jgi:hypothetical protein
MSDDTITLREGITAGIPIVLKADNTPIDLTSMNQILLVMRDAQNKVYRYSTTDNSAYLIVTQPTSGLVTFNPPAVDTFNYLRSPYKMYFWVYSTSSQRYPVPNKGESVIYLEKDF